MTIVRKDSSMYFYDFLIKEVISIYYAINQNELYHHGIKGMKWGVRRYRNEDGSLTPAGKKRYDRDVQENLGKKKENRIDTSRPDPNRWAREDLSRSKELVDTSSDVIKQLQKIERDTASKSRKEVLDLSNMSDQELRSKINRAMLEKQYNDLFAPEIKPKVSKGREITKSILETTGGVLAIGSSALGIALAIQKLKGGSD